MSIIVPCFNEAETILAVIEKVNALRSELRLEIIVIDDGSTDGSYDKLRGVGGVLLAKHEDNQGKGAAIATGSKLATGSVLVIQDADLEYDAAVIPQLVKPILDGSYDVVYGSRFEGDIEGMTLSHLVGNKILSYFTSDFCGSKVTDMMTGQKAFRATAFRNLHFESPRFEWELEVTIEALRKGYSYKEIPIPYTKRKFGEAKIGWADGLKTMLKLLRYYFRL